MVVVTIVPVIVVLTVVIKVLVCDVETFDIAAVVEVLAIDMLTDLEIIVVVVIVIVLKFVLSGSCFVNVPSNIFVVLFTDVLTSTMLGILLGIGIEVLANVNTNALTVVMTAFGFPVPTPLGRFSRWAAFDCWPLALLDCARVLQTLMPSYHV